MAGANNEFPILDRVTPSWADFVLKIQPSGASLLTARDVKSLTSGSTLEIGLQLAGGRVKQTTTGSASHEASMTLYLSGARAFEKALKEAAETAGYTRDGGVVQIGLVFFQVDYLFTPPGTDEIWERRLKGCRLLSDTEAPSEGTDATTVDYTLHVTERVKVVDGVEVAII
jgi:hypothetical protein